MGQTAWYGFKWLLNLFLMETMTHFFYYNAFAISGSWRQLLPLDIFIIGYGVLNFMWLKFLLIWCYFRFWSLIPSLQFTLSTCLLKDGWYEDSLFIVRFQQTRIQVIQR